MKISMLSANDLRDGGRGVPRSAAYDAAVRRPAGGAGGRFLPAAAGRAARTTRRFSRTNRAAWRELNPLICYLTEQHRQDDDEFLSVLSAIRAERGRGDALRAAVGPRHRDWLTRPQSAPKLFSHNADVDRINAAELAKLPGRPKKMYRMNGQGGRRDGRGTEARMPLARDA